MTSDSRKTVSPFNFPSEVNPCSKNGGLHFSGKQRANWPSGERSQIYTFLYLSKKRISGSGKERAAQGSQLQQSRANDGKWENIKYVISSVQLGDH